MRQTELGYIYECDKDALGNEMPSESQRNNDFIYPSREQFPKAQYRTTWKNMCNFTAYTMALRYAGYVLPSGSYDNPADDFADFFFNKSDILKTEFPSKYKSIFKTFERSLNGECTDYELKTSLCFPNEIHELLSIGANKWLKAKASMFGSKVDFVNALFTNMVDNNLPIVTSGVFAKMNHIVCVTGVVYDSQAHSPTVPKGILIDDPWGKYDYENDTYDTSASGNDIYLPWSKVVSKLKPLGSDRTKWCHIFNNAAAII